MWEAEREGLALNQWALYTLSQSVAFTEAYRELRSRLSRIDMVKAKETVWGLLTRHIPGAPRPAWDVTPRGWKEYERELCLGIPAKQPAARKVGRPKTDREPKWGNAR
jgi:hypothetical protein